MRTSAGLAHIRCGSCGARIGEIFSVPQEWQGRPFTWAECWWITDRETKPPRITRYMTILDDQTAAGDVETECPTHGIVSVSVRGVLGDLPALVGRWETRGRPGKVIARLAGA
ncbi:hypothetical protein [Modestobacter sp. I12A-02662]|uniref:hypothetical protein n=1 Tax=Modestobacter sp. I12A-02662 TaxID=1730496 RepID=UPI0034DE576B